MHIAVPKKNPFLRFAYPRVKNDAFVNKLRNVRDHGFGMETRLKFIFEQIASVARTIDKFFFEQIARAVRTDNNYFKRISQAVRKDDNFYQTDGPSRSNGRQFFPNR